MEITKSPLFQSNGAWSDSMRNFSQNQSQVLKQTIFTPKSEVVLLADQQVNQINAGYNFMRTMEPEHFSKASTNSATGEVDIAPSLTDALNKILSNGYGRDFYNKIITHPQLRSLEISEPAMPASIRKGIGMSPTAITNFTSRGSAGTDASITMDAGMSARIVTKSGDTKEIGTDSILFHELAHVWIHLNNEVDLSRSNPNWREDIENKASEYEGYYGGYQRDYYAPGG